MSGPVVIRVKEEESQRNLLCVPASTTQSAEQLHHQVQRAVRRARNCAAADISYTAGSEELSVSLGDVLNAARGHPLHASVAPQAGALDVTALVDVPPDQPRDQGAPAAAGSPSTSSAQQSNGGDSHSALKTAEKLVSLQYLALLYPKKPMKHDKQKGRQLDELGKGNLWQFADRGDLPSSRPEDRLAFRAFTRMILRCSTIRNNPAAGSAAFVRSELGRQVVSCMNHSCTSALWEKRFQHAPLCMLAGESPPRSPPCA